MKEPTEANEVSSRSHAVFLLTIEAKDQESKGTKTARLNMIDLAGSERAAYTNNTGKRMIEGANINRSLLALGNCINALSGIQKGQKKPHVPYRDSKLTRLLKESLCGNCRTVMIANISSAVTAYEDTLNTLKYANRAKNIKTYSIKNIKKDVEGSAQVAASEYVEIIAQLKKENQRLKSAIQKQNHSSSAGPNEKNQMNSSQIGVIQTMEKKIMSAFQNETEALTRLHAAEDTLDNFKHSLVKSLGKMDENIRAHLTTLKIRKQQCEEQVERVHDDREKILRVAKIH